MLKRFFIFTLLIFVSIQLPAQNACDVSVVTTDVRCNGQSNGTAKVVVNGQSTGNPQGCIPADATPAAYTTSCTRTYSGNSGDVLVGPGEQVCLSGSNFTGGIQVTGGTLVITGSATPAYMNLNSSNPSFTLVVIGTAQFSSLNLFGSSTVKNYGTLKVPGVGFNGTLENNGTLTVTGDLNINAPYGNFTNKGSVTVSSNFNNYNTTLNGGTIAVSGTLNNNSGGTLNNQCTITIGGDFNNNNKTINAGKITAGAKTALNGSSLYQGYAGSVLTTGSTTIDGVVQGMSSSCASVKVTGGAIVNSSAVFSGAIDYCAPNGTTNTGTFVAPSTKNCSCTSVSASYAWQSPLSGTTDTQSNLAAGTYSVLVSAQGCTAVTKTITIHAPLALSAAVTPTGLSVSVAASGGTAPYTYVWSGNQSTQSSASYAASGNYTVQVTDSKGCSTTENFTLTAPTTPPTGSCSVTVVTKNPTCAGAGDGSATVYLNGNILGTGVSGSTQTPAGCSAVQTSSYSCTTGCTQTVTDNTAGININGGQQVCLTATAYTGNINVTGGTLVICGKATPQNINYNTNGAAFTMIVNGELTLSNLNLPVTCTLKNYGKVTFTGSVSFAGRVENYGTMQAGGDFNNNASAGTFLNYGALSVSGNLNNNVQGTNSGTLTINGNLQINGSSTFTNTCTIQIGNELINNATLTNNGKITVAQWTRLNGSSSTTIGAGSSIYTQHLTLDGTVTGSGSTCSALKVSGQSIVNGSGKLQGQVSLCMGAGPNTFTGTVTAPATKTCSCVLDPIQYSSPLLGMNNPYQGLPAGTYSVTVQAEGCPATVKTFTITDPAAIAASVSISGKTATVTASGGQGTLIYTWTGGASGTGNTHTFVNDGTYQVTVSDSKNCSKTLSFQIPVQTTTDTDCGKLFVEYITGNQVRITCVCAGSACTIIPSTGIPSSPITTITRPKQDSTILVKTGPNTTLEVLVTGTEINTGTQVGTGSGVVASNTLAVASAVSAESCAGKKDGSIQLTISGGSGDYSISNNYNTQTNTTTINNVGAGDVFVKVIDNKTGYTTTVKVTVGIKPANSNQPVVSSSTATGEAASVSLQSTGGNATTNTVVQWSTGATGVGPVTVPGWLYSTGYITATVSENWACPQVLVLPVVTACSTSVAPALASTPASCYGSATGSVSITNLPANATVVWSGLPNLSTAVSVAAVAAGTYRADVFLTLSNGNKCKAGSASISVTQPAKLVTDVVQSTSNSNSYTAQVTGGTAPYTYQWSNGVQTASAVLATGGFYQLQVQDSKACVQTTQLDIPVQPCSTGISLDITQLSCTSANSGKITASSAVSGAAYYWSGSGISNRYNASQENISAGMYVVSVTGWNPQCLSRAGVRLKQPSALTAISKQSNGTVNILVSNGTPNYTVVWRFDNKQTDTRSDLTPGVSYTVDITDSKGCTLVYTFTYDPCSANPIKASVKMNDQVATPAVSGGVAPYTYLWKLETQGGTAIPSGQETAAVQHTINGIYSLTVTDSRSCNTTVQVSGPNCGMNALTVTKQSTSCKTICDGQASITGTLPPGAILTWNNQAVAYKLVNACAGTHTVQISNAQGCFIEKTFSIAAGSGTCPNPNPEVANPPGTGSGSGSGGGSNCTLQASVVTSTSKLSKQCADETAFIDVKITGGFAPYHMKWTVQRTSLTGAPVTELVETDKEDYQNALPGSYSLDITDQRGCTKTVTATVTGPVKALESTVSEKAAACPENVSGINFTLAGGVGPYTIRVLNSSSNPSDVGTTYNVSAAAGGAAVAYALTPNQGGSYVFEVKDAAGCTQIRSIAINNVEPEAKRFQGGIVASQIRLSQGQSAVLTAYNVSGYTLNWVNMVHPGTRSQTVSQPGVYQVVYTKTGCASYTRSITITGLPTDSIPKSMICTASQPVEIPVDLSDHCEEYKRLAAQSFGRYKYELYVAEQKQRIRNQYLAAVMGDSKEVLTMRFSDQEEHYTLYYYDQSGNLVRTIPPSGVKPLSDDKTNQAIDQMVSGSTAVITEHDYSTTYGYNSLNQLVHQDIPDHDRIDLWETAASGIDLNGASVANLAYAPAGSDGIMLANTTDKAQLYATADAGKTWEKNQNIGLGKITSISRVDASIVFAAGEKGTFLSSVNGGRSWTLLPLPTASTVKQVYFSSASTGWIITESGSMYTSGDGGHSWSEKTSLKTAIGVTNTLVEATVNKSNGHIWVISSANKIYQSTNNGSAAADWTEKTIASPTVNTVLTRSGSFIAAGPAGTIFTSTSSGNVQISRTSFGEQISSMLETSTDVYYVLTTAGEVYYHTLPDTWNKVTGLSGVTEITKDQGLVMAYTPTAAYAMVSGVAANTQGAYKRVRSYDATTYVGLVNNTLKVLTNFPSAPTVTNVTLSPNIAVSDFYIQGIKIVVLGTDNNVYEGSFGYNSGNSTYTLNFPDVSGVATPVDFSGASISSFIARGGSSPGLYVRSTDNKIFAYTSKAQVMQLSAATTVVSMSTSTDGEGYAVESGKIRRISAGVFTTSAIGLENSTLKAVAADNAGVYAAGSNGELYALNTATPAQFEYVAVVGSTDNFIDAVYTGSKLELLTATKQISYTPGDANLGKSATSYNNAQQIRATTTTDVVIAAAGSPITTETAFSVDGSMYPYLAGGDLGKIWYKENATAAYTAAAVNIQPLSGIAYADVNTIIAVGKQGTILRSTDKGASWKMEYSGTPNDLTAVSASGTTAVIIGANNTVLYYNTTAPNWRVSGGAPAGVTSVKAVSNLVLLTAGTSVYRSSNNGQNFTAETATGLAGNTATFRSITIDKDGYGFVVGDNGTGYRIAPVTTTTPANLTYTKIATDNTPNDDKGTGLPVANFKTVQFSDRMVGYITAAGLLLKTTDGGAHWKQETTGIGAGTGTPQLALSSDAQHGTLIDANGTTKVLRDQAETFSSRFWYDELGRLVLSQNAKQFNIAQYETAANLAAAATNGGTVRAYSYTLYDQIGRITEVGELLTDNPVTSYKNESQVQYAAHTAFASTGFKHQVSKTTYDKNLTPPADFTPTYLRNRVAFTTYQQEQSSPVQETHYSYDVHGNVNSLLQLIRHDGNVLAKTVDYEYDLISGKVNKVYYQKAKADQLIHAYSYDGDNRITKVETSTDNVLFTKEASYQYYAHGPLARTQLGELNVETENYTYTIQGWIKQMQAEAFSYALGYNNTDYASIGTATTLATPIATVGTTSKGLYNGNIASMTSKTPVIDNASWQQQYSYDQLNRITASATPGTTNAYKTTYSYDANGNIQNLARYDGDNTKFDELSYNYQTKAKGYLQNTNKLRWVDDAAGTTATTADIEDQSLDNYSYDAIGNLIKDNQEEIANIEWTVSGKVRRVNRTAASTKPNLEFEYDASGQRIVKKVIRKDGSIVSTYYLRDASGNVMAVYTYNSVSDDVPQLSEQYLYGSSRLGVYTPTANVLSKIRVFGRKSYELSDHLGNVRATLSDYRRAASQQIVNSATDYYPFGMVARSYSSSLQYRFGFNGQEKEGDAGSFDYDFGARMYDSRIARWLSIDPTKLQNADWTPYQFGKDCPIVYIDPDGAKEYIFITDINATTGKVKIMKLPAKALLMTDGIEHKVYEDSENYHYENYYYDFITNFIVVHNADGSVTTTKKVTIIKTDVPKDFEFVGPLDPFGDDYGDVMLDKTIEGMRGDSPCEWCGGKNNKEVMNGGIVFSGSADAASIPEMYRDAISKNTSVVEGDILDLLGGNSSSSPTTMMETAKTIADGLDKAVSAAIELRKQLESNAAPSTKPASSFPFEGPTDPNMKSAGTSPINDSLKVRRQWDSSQPGGNLIKQDTIRTQ